MLWYKAWLETRFRLLFSLVVVGFILVSLYLKNATDVRGVVGIATGLALLLTILLAGAGIATQPTFQATKGLHGSILFTLSMPVSRLRLLGVRAGFGWLEMAGGICAACCGMWILFPAGTATALDMVDYAGTLIACASGLYAISVLLATFLDDQWRVWGSGIVFGALWWLLTHTPLPASMNIFRAMGEGSPLVAHTMPWLTMTFSLGLAAILFFAAFQVVQRREY
jgi:hypothetical protein